MTPIVGITDDVRFPRRGKIHLGHMKEGKRGVLYPSQLPYFFVRESETTSADSVAAFKSVYEDEPTQLRIRFPTHNPEDWAPQYLEYWTASYGKTCQGTGEAATGKIDPNTDTWANAQSESWEYRPVSPCGEGCELFNSGRCKPVMRLSFILPDVSGIGIWQMDTSSTYSMRNINGMVNFVRAVAGGRIAMVPFLLLRQQVTVQPMGQKAKTVYIVSLQSDGLLTMGDMQALVEERGGAAAALLPAPHEEAPPDENGSGVEGEVVEEDEEPDEEEPLAEDDLGGTAPSSEQPPQFANPGEFFNRCYEELNLTKPGVLVKLGVSRIDAIRDLSEAYMQIKGQIEEEKRAAQSEEEASA